MRVGVSLRSGYVIDDARTGARWMIERARAAHDAGLDSLFVGDHHGVPVPYYQNSPMLGRLLAEWDDRPAGALYLLPLWNPVLVAEQVGTLAAIASGRFIMQCAIGGGAEQFAAMGADIRRRRLGLRAGARRRAPPLRGRERRRHADRARCRPSRSRCGSAVTPPRPSTAPPASATAGWPAPRRRSTTARELVTAYLERCAAHGRTPTAVAIRRDIHVGRGRRRRRTGGRPGARTRLPGLRPVRVRGRRARARGRDSSASSRAMGYTDVIVRHLADDQGEVLASLARLAAVRTAILDA